MANFIEKTLEKGETVVMKGRLHWSYNWEYSFGGFLLFAACAVGLIIDLANYDSSNTDIKAIAIGCVAGIIIGALLMFWGYFIRNKTEFAITNHRFIQKDGIFNIKMTEIPLFKVETVNFYQSIGQRLLGTGTIELVGSGGTSHQLGYVKNPYKVRNLLTTYMKEQHENAKE